MLNDISTDLKTPPNFYAIANKFPARNLSFDESSLEEHKSAYPALDGLPVQLPIETTFEQLIAVLKTTGWKHQGTQQEIYQTEWTATTSLLRFKDDIALELRPHIDGCVLHMRSKSRLGRSDLGANAKRIRQFFKQFKRALAQDIAGD